MSTSHHYDKWRDACARYRALSHNERTEVDIAYDKDRLEILKKYKDNDERVWGLYAEALEFHVDRVIEKALGSSMAVASDEYEEVLLAQRALDGP